MPPPFVTPAIQRLREAFLSYPHEAGLDVRLVGGCVRDHLAGMAPKDIDLSTNATPDEQVAAYAAAGIAYIETGIKHGTLTAKVDGELFEVTSLRGESNHDGRHAEVHYLRDWTLDQERRDLTVNSMMMDLDGNLHDPFGGEADLRAGRIAFVGDPVKRIREDYLRILRYFRFLARFGNVDPVDRRTADAISANAPELRIISRERMWSEMSRILTGPRAGEMLSRMRELGVSDPCGLPDGDPAAVEALEGRLSDPVAMAVAYLGDPGAVARLAEHWRWSTADANRGAFLAANLSADGKDLKRLLAHDKANPSWVATLARLRRDAVGEREIEEWDVPAFPVTGNHLAKAGYARGPEMGVALARMRTLWADTGYAMDAEGLMASEASADDSPAAPAP